MKLPSFFKGRGRKSAGAKSTASFMGLGPAIWTPRDYGNYVRESYQRNIIAFRCINLIAGSASAAPIVLFQGEKQLISHAVLDLINQPNPKMGKASFIESCIAYRLLTGNRYIEGVGPGPGRVNELWPLRPDRVTIIPNSDGTVRGFRYSVDGHETEKINQPGRAPTVIHGKTFNPMSDWYGQSPLEAAAMAVDSHNEATEWNKKLLQNDVRPSGALVQRQGSDPLDDDDRNRLKAELDERAGAKQTGRPMLLEGGLEWVQMMLSHHDIDWTGGKEMSAREIALALNVPEQLVGVKGQQTYNNYREARLALWEDAILPELYALMGELTNWFRQIYQDRRLTLAIDEDQIAALAPRREALWEKVNQAADLTLNEKRAAKGYEPIAGGDILLVSANQIPLTASVEGFDIDEGGGKQYGRDMLTKLAYGSGDSED